MFQVQASDAFRAICMEMSGECVCVIPIRFHFPLLSPLFIAFNLCAMSKLFFDVFQG